MADDELYPIAVLIEELKNQDVLIRLNSVKRISTIALALGAARTRTELIPCITDALDDEDEVLLTFAEELAKFVPLVGGPDYAYTVLPPLEILAQVEETVVHDKAVESLLVVGASHSPAHLEEYYVPLIGRLAKDGSWASRVSASPLIPPAYAKLSDALKNDMKKLFATLIEDDMPMVRRSAASNLGKLAAECSVADIKGEILGLYRRVIGDEQDNVRPMAVEAALHLGKVVPKDELVQLVVQPLHAVSKDRSWRVRHVLAEKYCDLEKVFGPEIARTEMEPLLVRLMQDQEKEVRTKAALQVPELCSELPLADRQTIISTSVMPHVIHLCSDQSQYVRVAMASVLLKLGHILGKPKSIELIVPQFARLLQDEFPDVRLSIIKQLDDLQQVVGKDVIVKEVLKEIGTIAEDDQWRVRLALCEQMPALAATLKPDGFDTSTVSLSGLTLGFLGDNVFSVRETAATTLGKISAEFGDAWTKEKLLPTLLNMSSEKAYLSRLTTLLVVRVLGNTVEEKTAKEVLLPIALKLAKDPVPNIRFNAAQALGVIITKLDKQTITASVQPALQEMVNDSDADVKYFSQVALNSC